MRFSAEQFEAFDALARENFFQGMKADLYRHHDSISEKEDLFMRCRAACKMLNIETEKALFAFFDMSFALGKPLNHEDGYMDEHAVFLHRFKDPERLPLELYERAG